MERDDRTAEWPVHATRRARAPGRRLVAGRAWRLAPPVLPLGMLSFRAPAALLFLLAACGCGGETTAAGGAGHHDAGPSDAGAAEVDAGPVDVGTGDGATGAPCARGSDCASGTCLGAPFSGGYCTTRIAECSAPGGVTDCAKGSICDNGVSAVVNGNPSDGDFCLAECTGPGACRSGYMCCSVRGFKVCAPASLCGD